MLQQPKGLEHGAHIAGLHITEIMTWHYETFHGNKQNAQKVHMFQRPQMQTSKCQYVHRNENVQRSALMPIKICVL